jgi:hypothetical protein
MICVIKHVTMFNLIKKPNHWPRRNKIDNTNHNTPKEVDKAGIDWVVECKGILSAFVKKIGSMSNKFTYAC